MKEGYVDYILTTNFDDLMLKSCALFNFIPPVYDASNLNDFTTTTFLEKSVTYLHGQHHGQWLLNAEGEIDKVKTTVPKIFERICNGRTWIIVGYKGEDGILDKIAKIGSFENELYWVGYENEEPIDSIKILLLEKERMNAYYVPNYNSDSFFLQLHAEIDLHTPEIFNKPFTFLKEAINKIKDIEGDKELTKNINDRFITTKKWVDDAIINYETKESLEKITQEIIEDRVKEKFDNATYYLNKINDVVYEKASIALSELYNTWGLSLINNGLPNEAKDKFEMAIKLDSLNGWAHNNLGSVILDLAKQDNNLNLLKESFEKFEKASEIMPDNDAVFYNWGNALQERAKRTDNIDDHKKALEKFNTAIKINLKNSFTYNSKGLVLFNIAKFDSNNISLYKESIEQFKISIRLNSNNSAAYYNCATVLLNYYRVVSPELKEDILILATLHAQKGYDLAGLCYNMSCCFALLSDKINAFAYLKKSLENKEVPIEEIQKDSDWKDYLDDTEFNNIIAEFKQ